MPPWGVRSHWHADPACGMFHNHKHIEEAKGERDHHAEVTGHNSLRMFTHKVLASAEMIHLALDRNDGARQIFAHRAWGYTEA